MHHIEHRSQSWSLKVGEPFAVAGTVRKGDNNCWLIESSGLPFPMQLEGLDSQLQRDGLSVALTVYVEDDRVATSAPWMLLFVDDASLA
jgi:hypothetical protein